MNTSSEHDSPVISFKSHRRTITETDIVNFVNLLGLHEPFFIDMEYISNNLAEGHRTRFAPGPMVISLGMGLVLVVAVVVVVGRDEHHPQVGCGCGEPGGVAQPGCCLVGPVHDVTDLDAGALAGVVSGSGPTLAFLAADAAASARIVTTRPRRH